MVVALNEPKYAFGPAEYRCIACAGEVPVAGAFFSAIFFEGESFQRRNYCLPCWGKSPPAGGEVFASWRSKRPQPNAPVRRIRFDPELVLQFFRRLGEPPADPSAAAASGEEALSSPSQLARLRLVLALLLLRRKILVYQSSAAREGREWLRLTEKSAPERAHLVENPTLSSEELEQVKGSLVQLLQMDLG